MRLHVQAKVFLENINSIGSTPLHLLSAKQARKVYEQRPDYFAPARVEIAAVEERCIDHADTEMGIAVRIYTPLITSELLPVLVFYHGGGMVIGSLDSYDTLCRQLAAQSACIVVSVGYRLAPEHRFPTAVNDAFVALQWVRKFANTFGGDSHAVGVGGDSAGGSLAAVVCLLARDYNMKQGGEVTLPPLRCQILIYPATAPHADTHSHFQFAKGYFLERDTVLWFHNHYIRTDDDRNDFRYAPLIAESLAGLPPAMVIVAGYDTLRDEGVAYAQRLQAEGGGVELVEYEGMFHPFVSLAGVLDDGQKAIVKIAQTMRQYLFPYAINKGSR